MTPHTSNHPYGDLESFFPATNSDFTRYAGPVKQLKESDFEDIHRRRHLDSFAQSMSEWAQFPSKKRQLSTNAFPAESNEVLDTTFCPKLEAFVTELYYSLSQDAPDLTSDILDKDVSKGLITITKDSENVTNPDSTFTTHISSEKSSIGEDNLSSTSSTGLPSSNSTNALLARLRKKYHTAPSKSQILSCYRHLVEVKKLPHSDNLSQLIRKKAVRSNSGVCVITVLTSPGEFSCPKDCHYCPNEPGQPRSYLSTEPAVLRANQNGWDAYDQFFDRANNLKQNGHVIDKIEILVLGGTWSGYPHSYQYMFIRDLFYAANVYSDPLPHRNRLSLEDEQSINETAKSRIIGLTLETRPDYITKQEIQRLRYYGCTRVQIGVQHTDEEILKVINRGCTTQQCVNAIRMLKDAAYKVDIHLMPDLPTSTPEKDLEMFDWVLSSPSLQVDQWKIYPCEVTPFSKIEEWYKEGLFIPYTETDSELLIDLLIAVKSSVHPWIRLNRVIRDIPNQSIIAGNNKTNLRQVVLQRMGAMNLSCRCIRCREVKDKRIDPNEKAVLKIRHYKTEGGDEYFFSFETLDERFIFGFLRLRLPQEDADLSKLPFPILRGSALLRELHVYGIVVAHNEKRSEKDTRQQHRGIGSHLILAAELFAFSKGYLRMVVIAGIGTREYYKKFGYRVDETYMFKDLTKFITPDIEIPHQIAYMPVQHVDTSGIKASNAKNLINPPHFETEIIDIREKIETRDTAVMSHKIKDFLLFLGIGSYILLRYIYTS